MKFTNLLSCFFLMMVVTSVSAQGYRSQDNPWILGIGVNIVYDPGALFSGLFDIKDNYNYHAPVRVSIEKRFGDDYGFEVSGNFNKLLEDKVVNGGRLEEDIDFFALDGMFKYYITNTYLNTHRAIYEGYIASGFGASFYNSSGAKTANLAVGFNIYLSESVRFNAQATGKISIDNSTVGTNYIHYNMGLIIRLEDSHFE